jgi:hypothetical protein
VCGYVKQYVWNILGEISLWFFNGISQYHSFSTLLQWLFWGLLYILVIPPSHNFGWHCTASCFAKPSSSTVFGMWQVCVITTVMSLLRVLVRLPRQNIVFRTDVWNGGHPNMELMLTIVPRLVRMFNMFCICVSSPQETIFSDRLDPRINSVCLYLLLLYLLLS